ncbi:MAG: hypothetical protein RL147_655 [Actinomycetota bacterium]|jgi:hypothetical protein
MNKKFLFLSMNKSSVGLLVLALIVGGMGAQATGVLNSPTGGYLVCVDSSTQVVTYPAKTKCPKGFKKLVLGAQGATGLFGKDGKTLLNGITDPESTIGAPGDMFINTVTKVLFGPKDVVTGWPAGVSMVGPSGSGSVGPAGAPGSNATLTCAQGGTCIVGNTGPGGGIVFYVQTATATAPWRYLEAAPNTWSGGVEDPTMKWCSVTNDEVALLATGDQTSVHTLETIGSGFRNTKMMLGTCTFGAANMAASYNGGGKSDWFLPSKGELNALYSAKATIGGFQESFYWTSFEASTGDAYYKHFQNGDENFRAKSENNYVRPVRAF